MKFVKTNIVCVVSLLLFLNSTAALSSANSIVDRNPDKGSTIEKFIRQHIALGRLKNKFFHPIIANSNSRTTTNPFRNVPKKLSLALTQKGIDLSVLARYKAIYFQGKYLGSQSRKIINTSPNIVLVIGKGTRLHDPIFSRGPVVVEADVDDIAGIYASNIVWFNQQTKTELPSYNPFIGMPVVNGRVNPDIITAPQSELNKIKQIRKRECQDYTKLAIEQYNENRQLGCGFKGSRWNNNWKGQYNWCLSVLRPLTLGEENFRNNKLASCKKKIVSTSNTGNQPPIPAKCNDPGKQYKAIKQINHSFRYEKTLKSPVANGMIRHDYNFDKRHDYVFLEVNGDKARVAMCFSDKSGYQRRITDIEFYAPGHGLIGGRNFQISQVGDLLKVNIQLFEHNIGSSSRKVSYRYQPKTKKFKIITNKADSVTAEPDGFMSTPETPALF